MKDRGDSGDRRYGDYSREEREVKEKEEVEGKIGDSRSGGDEGLNMQVGSCEELIEKASTRTLIVITGETARGETMMRIEESLKGRYEKEQ